MAGKSNGGNKKHVGLIVAASASTKNSSVKQSNSYNYSSKQGAQSSYNQTTAKTSYKHIGIIEVVPAPTKSYGVKQSKSYNYPSKQGAQSNYNQITAKTSYVDKQTGSYARATNKESFSTGDSFKERSTGRVGSKDECKTTSTYRVGDKSGYTEYQVEERFRKVSYGGGSNKEKGKYINYY